tara:strand:- start:23057 stop:23470 length:414 start_codon:yes stop_codon:yes gene_type:complete
MNELLTTSISSAKRIKEGYENVGRRAHIAFITGLGMLSSEMALATPTIGQIGTNAGDQSTGLTSGALRLAGFVGIVMVIIAFVKGRNAKQQGEGIGTYIGMGILGALLLSVPIIIAIVNTSLIGSDASATMQGKIIQ